MLDVFLPPKMTAAEQNKLNTHLAMHFYCDHSKLRNRLGKEKVEKLVYLKFNAGEMKAGDEENLDLVMNCLE